MRLEDSRSGRLYLESSIGYNNILLFYRLYKCTDLLLIIITRPPRFLPPSSCRRRGHRLAATGAIPCYRCSVVCEFVDHNHELWVSRKNDALHVGSDASVGTTYGGHFPEDTANIYLAAPRRTSSLNWAYVKLLSSMPTPNNKSADAREE